MGNSNTKTVAVKTVGTWASSLRVTEYEFFAVTARAFEQWNAGNYTELSKLLCITGGKKSGIITVIQGDRTQYNSPLMRILFKAGMTNKKDTTLPITFKFDPKKKSGVTYINGDNAHIDTEVIEALKVLGRNTIKSDAFKTAFPAIPRDDVEFNGDTWAERQIKTNGNDKIDIMIAALQARRVGAVNKAA